MVQLGLCAFRHGMIKDTHNALHDVQSSGRAKELLAQVCSATPILTREKNVPWEKELKNKQLHREGLLNCFPLNVTL